MSEVENIVKSITGLCRREKHELWVILTEVFEEEIQDHVREQLRDMDVNEKCRG